jgi:hypothetical protein
VKIEEDMAVAVTLRKRNFIFEDGVERLLNDLGLGAESFAIHAVIASTSCRFGLIHPLGEIFLALFGQVSGFLHLCRLFPCRPPLLFVFDFPHFGVEDMFGTVDENVKPLVALFLLKRKDDLISSKMSFFVLNSLLSVSGY